MNTPQNDEIQGSESVTLALSQMEALPITDSSCESGTEEAAPGPRPGRIRIWVMRVLVLLAVGLATGVLLLAWSTSLIYRAAHTVTNHATVKGRVHRIGARIDGQVKQMDVQ